MFLVAQSAHTELFLHGLLRFDVILLEFVVELLQSLEILDDNPHLLDFLSDMVRVQ